MKRSRYTAYLAKGDPKVILAYSPGSVRDFYECMGHTVVRVERGDYRRKARVAEARSQARPWRLDRAALAEVIDFLGLEMPVTVKQTSRVGAQSGCHNFKPAQGQFYTDPERDTACGGMTHHITVKDYIGPERASEVIWHELTHAMQAERAAAGLTDPRDQFDAWAACKIKGVYRESPIEREARDYERFASEIRPAV